MAKLTTEDTRLASMVKRANTRLRQLESSNLTNYNAYNFIEKVYTMQTTPETLYTSERRKVSKVAMTNTMSLTTDSSGRIKFNTSISKLDTVQKANLRKLVSDFLNAPTSTVSGIKRGVKQAKETLEKKLGYGVSYEQLQKVFALSKAQAFKETYGSDAIIELIDKYNITDERVIDKFLTEFTIEDESGERVTNLINTETQKDMSFTKEGKGVILEKKVDKVQKDNNNKPLVPLSDILDSFASFNTSKGKDRPTYTLNRRF